MKVIVANNQENLIALIVGSVEKCDFLCLNECMEETKIEGQQASVVPQVVESQPGIGWEKSLLTTEGKMGEEVQTGLTEEQKKNMEIMKAVENKYPDAFRVIDDGKGEKVLIAHGYSLTENFPQDAMWVGNSLVFTKEGVMAVANKDIGGEEGLSKNIDWGKFGVIVAAFNVQDLWIEDKTTLHLSSLLSENADKTRSLGGIGVMRLDMEDDYTRGSVKKGLSQAQSIGERLKAKESPRPLSTMDIINDL
jgi:hypothetical protein